MVAAVPVSMRSLLVSPAATVMLCLLLSADGEAGKLYRWVDEDGNVQYTDRLPPDASDDAHQVMDRNGTVTEDKESSAVERERRRQREAERAAERRRAEQARRQAEERQRRDRIILQTFVTERDIELTRNNRIEAVQVQINIVEDGIERLESRRAHILARLDNLPDDSTAAQTYRERLSEVDASLEQRRTDRAQLESKRADIQQLFGHYLERFRELQQGGK